MRDWSEEMRQPVYEPGDDSEFIEQMEALDAKIAATNPKPRTDSRINLDGIGSLIEDDHRFEEASALCLLSIARSSERIADALEKLGRGDFSFERSDFSWVGGWKAK